MALTVIGEGVRSFETRKKEHQRDLSKNLSKLDDIFTNPDQL